MKRFGNATLQFFKQSAQPIVPSEAEQLNLLDSLESTLSKLGVSFDGNATYIEKVKLLANFYATNDAARNMFLLKKRELHAEAIHRKTVEEYEAEELAEMREDFFNDRSGFDIKRRAFVRKVDASTLVAEKITVTIGEKQQNYVA